MKKFTIRTAIAANLLLIAVLLNLDATVIMEGDDPDPYNQEELFERRSHTYAGTTLPYRLFIPQDYDSESRYPLVLQLHGQTLGGTDNEKQISGGLVWADSINQAQWPCFVVAPQKLEEEQWADHQRYGGPNEIGYLDFTIAPISNEMETVMDLLDSLISAFAVDTNRLYIAGGSSGGFGVYDAIYRFPHKFAAAIVLCAPSDTTSATVSKFIDVPLWIMHGELDASIPCLASRWLVATMERLGRECVYTHCNFHLNDCTGLTEEEVRQAIETGAQFLFSEWPGLGHSEPFWTNAWYYPLLPPWTFAQKKDPDYLDMDEISIEKISDLIQLWNYPNPFHESTTLRYDLANIARVRITILDLTGRELEILVNENQPAGEHELSFNVKDLEGGIYFCRMLVISGEVQKTTKVIKLIVNK